MRYASENLRPTKPQPRRRQKLELWGGIECTVNRVGDTYFDQVVRTGHESRLSDLDRIAELGIRTLRYPVLWERTAPNGIDNADWRWPDERLGRLGEHGIRPIVGLVHHGSGPRDTSLMDWEFPRRLAAYAQAVARRYPWVSDYTPINEPLTTARFSGLYGHWFPHERSDKAFVQALLIECCATIEAMRAIRQVNPAARLIQTEDIAHIDSTPELSYQAQFENERRWLGFDLLCGRVNRDHALWDYLMWTQADQNLLNWLADNPCMPDVLGLNYYPTSERFLDDRLHHYPDTLHGGNGRTCYVDVEAVRVRQEGLCGLPRLLRDTWERYGLPLAVTECHLGCDADEQVRWLGEIWEQASTAASEIPIEAVTVWSLFGAYDWDSLVTQNRNHYEAGVFNISSGKPLPTPLTEAVRVIAARGKIDAPVLPPGPGWWRRPERLLYPPPVFSGETEASDILDRDDFVYCPGEGHHDHHDRAEGAGAER